MVSSVQFGNPIAFLGVPQVFSGSLNGPGVHNAGPFSIPNNTRTVFISLPQNVVLINNLYVVGATGYIYRFGGVPYLTNLLVLQISGAVESSIYIQIGFTGPGNIPINVYTDNVVTLESSLYIGKVQGKQLIGVGTLINGPVRILGLQATTGPTSSYSIALPLGGVLRADNDKNSAMTMPPNTLLATGESLVTGGSATGVAYVTYAYP